MLAISIKSRFVRRAEELFDNTNGKEMGRASLNMEGTCSTLLARPTCVSDAQWVPVFQGLQRPLLRDPHSLRPTVLPSLAPTLLLVSWRLDSNRTERPAIPTPLGVWTSRQSYYLFRKIRRRARRGERKGRMEKGSLTRPHIPPHHKRLRTFFSPVVFFFPS